jgi:hypothetical protein
MNLNNINKNKKNERKLRSISRQISKLKINKKDKYKKARKRFDYSIISRILTLIIFFLHRPANKEASF